MSFMRHTFSAAVTLAVTGSAALAEIVFSEDFDVDHTANWTVNRAVRRPMDRSPNSSSITALSAFRQPPIQWAVPLAASVSGPTSRRLRRPSAA